MKELLPNGFEEECNECPQQADWHVFIGQSPKQITVNLCNEHFGDFGTANRAYGSGIYPVRLTK